MLFQARGYSAVGVAEILSVAQVPKGCLYHHFPGGKAELAAAAVSSIGAQVTGRLETAFAQGEPPSELMVDLAREMAGWLIRTGFAYGALLSVLSAGALQDPHIAAAIRCAYEDWLAVITRAFARAGCRPEVARANALCALAVLEGGLVLARGLSDPAVVHAAAEVAARALEDLDAP